MGNAMLCPFCASKQPCSRSVNFRSQRSGANHDSNHKRKTASFRRGDRRPVRGENDSGASIWKRLEYVEYVTRE
jgi:hypothetical protein